MTPDTLSTDRIACSIDRENFRLKNVHNRTTGETFAQQAEQRLLIRTPSHVSEPEMLTVKKVDEEGSGIRFHFGDESGQNTAVLHMTSGEHGLRCQLHVTAAEPVWLMEWRLSGLSFEQVIVPALGGQVIDTGMPDGTTLSYKYPFWWNAQFVIGKTGQGGLLVRSMDDRPLLKLLRIARVSETFELTYGFEAEAPIRSTELEAEWYLDGFQGNWRHAVDHHRAWLEKAFNLVSLAENPYFPEWAGEVDFMLELWGDRKDLSVPNHTFEQMQTRIREWAEIHSPQKTLLYLPGFAEHGIDSHAPDYNPGPRLGGDEKFKELVDTAHELGYPVMVHTNVLAMTFSHPLYPEFKKHQVVDLFDRPQGWGLDMDGDWLTEPYFAYINPGAKEWGDLMDRVLGNLISKFGIDAIHLDQTLLAFNVNRGPNFVQGMRDHVRRLQQAFPHVLFAGEGQHEHVLPVTPLAQIHGIDSIADVHGMEGQKPWRRVHPVSTYLFGKYTRFVPHLLTRHPSHPMFAFQEAAYSELGIMPALVLYDASQPMDLPQVAQMLDRAAKLKSKSHPNSQEQI